MASPTTRNWPTTIRDPCTVWRAMMAARWDYYTRQPVGALAAAFSTQSDRAAGSYLFATTIASQFIQIVLYSSIAFAVSWRATLVAGAVGAATAFALSGLVRMARRALTALARSSCAAAVAGAAGATMATGAASAAATARAATRPRRSDFESICEIMS